MDNVTDIGKLRSKAARNDGSKWTAADAIKDFAREVESGAVKPECLMILFTETVDGKPQVGYRNVTPTGLVALGILERVKWHINSHGEGPQMIRDPSTTDKRFHAELPCTRT